ncbi:MAG: 3D domain-containing protein [Oligoflexia bacterium]|nr:3D domain-containing protein [Oligoflexia bacterium]
MKLVMKNGAQEARARISPGKALSLILPFLPALLWTTLLCGGARAEGPEEAVLGSFRNTYYYIALEEDFRNLPINDTIRDLQDRVIARVSARFKKSLALEGTGKLLDGRVVNFAGRKNGETRYRVTSNPFGDGVGTCALLPFHTVAVDPTRIPLGSLVQIDETVGMLLPDGSRHDGLWRAEDVGGAIKKDRIDLFIGASSDSGILDRQGITHLQALTVRLVEAPRPDSCAQRLYSESHVEHPAN